MGYNYFDNLTDLKKDYFKILGEFPDFLYEYINTKEMQKQDGISVSCGTIYSKMFNDKIWWSSLDHSIAVALIIWNFTYDKKQALAGLFHDIATPCFKHSIDFMNGDAKTQESTEDKTSYVIRNSKEIMNLLNRDNIELEEVDDYKKYSIADNKSPRLSADRLEYTLSNGLGATKQLVDLNTVKEIYDDIIVGANEDGELEISFKNIEPAKKFVSIMSELSSTYIDPKHRFSMQYLGELIQTLVITNRLTIDELYSLSDKEVINIIKNCDLEDVKKSFDIWQKSENVYESDDKVIDRFCVNVDPKIRYIDPLVYFINDFQRISYLSKTASNNIEKAKNYRTKKYIYSNFNF